MKGTDQAPGLSALRGEFRIQRPLMYALSLPVGLLTYVGLRLLNETHPIAQLGPEWAIAAVVVLLLFGVPFAITRDDVRIFRITDDEQVLISRGRAEEVLHVNDYRKVSAVPARAGLARPIARLVFAGHVAGGRRVVIPLASIRSRVSGTRVPGQAVADFFQERCERAGFAVRRARDGQGPGWTATREPPGAASQAATAPHGHGYLVAGRIITADGRSLPVELTVEGAGPLAASEARDAALALLREEHPQCVWEGEAAVKAADAVEHE